jgi:hypothetical protein
MAERYNQVHGKNDIKVKTIDETRLNADGKTKGYILKVQSDGSVAYEILMAQDLDLRLFLFDG